MTFYCIAKTKDFIYPTAQKTVFTTIELLQQACENKNIPFKLIKSWDTDATDIHPTQNDCIYRVTMDEPSKKIEERFFNDGVKHLYKKNIVDPNTKKSIEQLNKAGVPVIPFAEKPYNYPLVVKVFGKMHGAGLHKIENEKEHKTLMQELQKNISDDEILTQQFFPHTSQARLIVLDNKVIASHENYVTEHDYRTNAVPEHLRKRAAKVFDAIIQQAAVDAVNAMGLYFGGVDILINENAFAVAEVNFPCYFARTQQLTAIDIAGMMIASITNNR